MESNGRKRQKPKDLLRVVYIEWVDATATVGWDKFDRKDATVDDVRSIGFLVKETNDFVSLAAAVSGPECNALINIPKKWIKKRRNISI